MKLELKNGAWRLSAEGPAPVRHLLSALHGRPLGLAAAAVRAGHGLGLDAVGFDYPDDRDEDGDERYEGVSVYDPLDEVVLSEADFERMMLMAFDLWLAQPVEEPWWGAFCGDVEAIRGRLG